jgi:hypothetical protein
VTLNLLIAEEDKGKEEEAGALLWLEEAVALLLTLEEEALLLLLEEAAALLVGLEEEALLALREEETASFLPQEARRSIEAMLTMGNSCLM